MINAKRQEMAATTPPAPRPVVTELVFKGPPRQARKQHVDSRGAMGFALLICLVATIGLVVRAFLARHAKAARKAAKADKDGLVTPDGFDLKESRNPTS